MTDLEQLSYAATCSFGGTKGCDIDPDVVVECNTQRLELKVAVDPTELLLRLE